MEERKTTMAVKAVQQIMLGSAIKSEADAKEVLHKVKQAGYNGIELNGFMIRPTPFLVRMLTKFAGMPVGKGGNYDWISLVKEAGLYVVAVHEDLGTVKKEPEAVIAEAKAFGTKYVVITGMYRFDYSDESAVRQLARDLNEAGKRLLEDGIHLLYHNHNCELRKVSKDRTAYDLLIEETNPEYVNFELDSYWLAEAGVDPLLYMKLLGNRMKLYHINDRGSRIEGASMTPILNSDCMELGYGNMNLAGLVEQALSVGADAVILETHKNWVEKSPVKSLELSVEFLNQHMA